jgi:hypothetical protein
MTPRPTQRSIPTRPLEFLATLHEHIDFVPIKLADRRRRGGRLVDGRRGGRRRRCGHGRRFNGLYWELGVGRACIGGALIHPQIPGARRRCNDDKCGDGGRRDDKDQAFQYPEHAERIANPARFGHRNRYVVEFERTRSREFAFATRRPLRSGGGGVVLGPVGIVRNPSNFLPSLRRTLGGPEPCSH